MHKCMHKRCADILSKLVIIGFISVGLLALISCESRKAGSAEQADKKPEKAGGSIQDAGKRDSP